MLWLALRMLGRDWRASELRVLAMAVLVAVASVTSVAFFANRVSRALVLDAHQLLGADLVLESDHPWKQSVAEEIAKRRLAYAEALGFLSMAQAGSGAQTRSQLASIKAVSESFPLRGRLRVAPALGAPDAPVAHGPAPGTVWLEQRLVSELGAPVGGRIRLGARELRVAGVLTLEPDRGRNFFNLAPRVLMNIRDVPSTDLVQTGSRVRYSLYAAGPARTVAAFEHWVRARLERGQRLEDLSNSRPQMRAVLERAQRFLGLSALLAAIIAGVAVALATRRFVERHLDAWAVMRCFGATQARLLTLYGLEFLALGLGACVLGCFAGFGAQQGFGALLSGLIQTPLPSPTLLPALRGMLVGLVLLLGFALPPLVRLKNVPALRVMWRERDPTDAATYAAYTAGGVAAAALVFWQAGDVRLGAYVGGGFAVAIGIFVVLAWVALRLGASRCARRLVSGRRLALRHGLASLVRRARSDAVQVVSLALGLTAVLLLTLTRNELIDAWRRTVPPDAPNRFVIGIQPHQVRALKAFFIAREFAVPRIFPMVRARLTAVNEKLVVVRDYSGERARHLAERAFNLSYMAKLPKYNRIVAGRWSAGHDAPVGLSIEEGIAKTLGWKLGDTLTFDVAGQRFSARITSLRKVQWDSMHVNFFVIASPRLLASFPTSYITAFRVAPGQGVAMRALTQRFPNLTVVDVGAVVREAQAVINELSNAVQFVFLFALGAAMLVLYSALLTTEDERRREAALMRVLGASRRQIIAGQGVEFLAMGLLAGALAALGSSAIGWTIARQVFNLALPVNGWLLLAGPLTGVVLLLLNAWLSAHKVLKAAPSAILREQA